MDSRYSSAVEKLDLQKILHHISRFAYSDLGKEAVEQLEPCSDLGKISVEHNRITEMKSILEGGNDFPLDGLKDIRTSLQRAALENSVLTGKELYDIAVTIKTSHTVKHFIEGKSEILPELFSLTSDLSTYKEIEFNIFQAIDENFEVKDSASKELKNVRIEIAQKQLQIRKALEKILRASTEQGMTQDEIVTTRDGRMVIPIKAELKNRFPGFIHSTSSSGQTVFIEPSETLTLNNDICELIFKERREVEKILRELTSQIRSVLSSLHSSVKILSLLDLYYANAQYSIEIKGNKPFLKESGSIVIQHGFHPLLLLKHQRETIVPLDLELGNANTILLITGPNAGGKTVALKSVGLLALMVQCGIHVPVSPDSEFAVVSGIFVLVGDNQSIENDLSTFSSQILQLKDIIDSATESSLILIDEIGSNTDPAEGAAIAASVLECLGKIGSLTIATSHQASLKAFVYNSPGMENAAMEFDQKTLLPTYRLKIGLPGSSYALEIAERLGLDEKVITKSRHFLGDQKTKLEQLIIALENQSQELKNKLQSADDNLLHYKALSQEYESKLKDLKNEIKILKRKAVDEAKQMLTHASATIENLIKEIRTSNADKGSIIKSKSYLSQFNADIEKIEAEMNAEHSGSENNSNIPDLAINDIITVKSGGQTGIVISLPDKKGILTVAFNSIKAKIHIDNISNIKKNSDQKRTVTSSISLDKTALAEVDIRGYYSNEAVSLVDKFIDDAVLSGLHRVDIIHGKGTGALRKAVHKFLESDERVKSQRLGELNEGGAGVTVVDLA